MDDLTPEVSRLLAAKETRRRRLAALPFPDKVRIVRELQAMAAPLWRARGHRVHVWPMETRPPPTMTPREAVVDRGTALARA